MESQEDVVHLAAHPTGSNHSVQPIQGNHQLVIITQLLQIAGSMRHIDELFLWLSHMTVQRLGVEVVQFWAQTPQAGRQNGVELRSMVCQNIAVPRQIVVNAQVIEIIERLLRERRGVMPQAVGTVFSRQHVTLLTRHQLNYWASYYLHSSALLPAPNDETSASERAVPLTMIVSLFLRQPPNSRLLPTIGHVMEQMVPIAKNRGLLLNEEVVAPPMEARPFPAREAPPLLELIPQRSAYNDMMQAHNPFSSTAIISDKAARQLYLAIDGRKNLAELLTQASRAGTHNFYASLRLLLSRHYIQLYEPGGQPVDALQILKILQS